MSENDCLLTFSVFAQAFRHLSNDEWAQLIDSGVWDAFIRILPVPEHMIPESLTRLLTQSA